MPKYNQVTSRHVEELQLIVGKNQVIYDDHEKMEPYSHYEVADPAYAAMPAVVVKLGNAEEIAAIFGQVFSPKRLRKKTISEGSKGFLVLNSG